ncbi:uncharacterized protein TNCV_757391 [Trichonephila clavipes]|nr:uncharacterized protein TNCV_757391 [Trichonephila clavipes]
MATGSYLTQNHSRSQSEIQGDLHNGAQRINTENRVGSSFRIIPEQYFSGVENINDFLENIDNNLAYYEIPAQLACAYLKGHLNDWLNINVALFSYTRAFGDGPRNFEPWSSDVDDT